MRFRNNRIGRCSSSVAWREREVTHGQWVASLRAFLTRVRARGFPTTCYLNVFAARRPRVDPLCDGQADKRTGRRGVEWRDPNLISCPTSQRHRSCGRRAGGSGGSGDGARVRGHLSLLPSAQGLILFVMTCACHGGRVSRLTIFTVCFTWAWLLGALFPSPLISRK